ncbi:MAG TPA: hypothetical protein VIF62_31830 [Labilithrix sp.]
MKKRGLVVQIVCLAVAFVLGVILIARRSGADEPKERPRGGGAKVAAAADAGPPAPAKADDDKKDDKKKDDDKEDQIETAVVGPDGGVPIHTQGEFRSPFANPDFGGIATVRVGLVLNDLTQYSIQNGTFVADFYLSLTSDRPMPSMDLMFPNGNSVNKEVIADKPTFKFYRFTGTFMSTPNLRSFPFDQQELSLQVEENTEGIDQIRLEPDRKHTKLENGFEVTGWDVSFLEARAGVHDYPDRFDNDDLYYSRYTFKLGITRYGTSAMFTVFVPAIVIVLIALMGMWVTPDEMEVRSNAGAPMLAGAVLFHFALMQQLPAVSYLTRADKLMMGVYISLLFNMVSTWAFFLVEEEQRHAVYIWARRIVPPVTAVIMVIACTA